VVHIAGALYPRHRPQGRHHVHDEAQLRQAHNRAFHRAAGVWRRRTVTGATGKAAASEWSVKPEASQIGFEVSGAATPQGRLGQYKAEIEFDPDAPEQAAVRVLLNMNSAATGTADTDDAAKNRPNFLIPLNTQRRNTWPGARNPWALANTF